MFLEECYSSRDQLEKPKIRDLVTLLSGLTPTRIRTASLTGRTLILEDFEVLTKPLVKPIKMDSLLYLDEAGKYSLRSISGQLSAPH